MKRLFSIIAILILAFVLESIDYFSKDALLLFTNVEALSQVEHGKYIRCYNRIKSDPMDTVRYCGNCDEIPGTWKSSMDYCIP